jgi:hypothetical protein
VHADNAVEPVAVVVVDPSIEHAVHDALPERKESADVSKRKEKVVSGADGDKNLTLPTVDFHVPMAHAVHAAPLAPV